MGSPNPASPIDERPIVLIVDDDEYVHGTLEAALRGLHLRLLRATTAEEGERLALQHRPALAIVDLGLPDRDGYQLTASLRALGLPTRILILTGHALDERAALAAGASALIAKPFGLHHFLDVVHELLGRRAPSHGPRGVAASSSSPA